MLPQSASVQAILIDKHSHHPTRIFWWVILLLLGVAWLGIIGLDQDAMWYDEIYSYIYAGGQQYHPSVWRYGSGPFHIVQAGGADGQRHCCGQ